MGLRETLRKAASLLVELPPEEPRPEPAPAGEPAPEGSAVDKLLADLEAQAAGAGRPVRTVEQIARETDGPALEEVRLPADAPPALTPEGEVDFAGIYRRAGLPPAPFAAEQMLEMMQSLPAELPLETRRQTVRVSLVALGRTIGASPETVVADASRKLAALNAHVEGLKQQTGQQVETAEREIAALLSQVEQKRTAIREAQARLQAVTRGCEAESARLDDVLEFFSLDVPPSRYAEPGR